MNEKLEIVGISDIDELMSWRAEVIRAVFGIEASDTLLQNNRDYYLRHIPDGSHIAVKAVSDGEDAGCGALCFHEELPSPDNPSGKCGYLMNIYVRPQHRNRGIAHEIVKSLVNKCKTRDCGKIYLETTKDAKSLYSSLGFQEMKAIMHLVDQ